MTVGVQSFCGDRLKEARLSRGMFKKTLGDLIGVSGTAIGRYEDGLDKPQPDKLISIASHLAFSERFFSTKAWSETLEPVFWRSRASETKSARDMTEQRMRWLCETFNFLNEEVDFPPLNLPALDLPADFRMITPDMIEDTADELRNEWKLRSYPIPDVILALENAGIPVATLDIVSDKQDGFFFRSSILQRCFVGINTYNVSCARARYDAAHEIGHAILHRLVTPQQERDSVSHKVLEQQAHRFAGAFLFPKKSFLSEVGFPSLDYFASLKKTWGMSIGAMVYRAFNLGLIEESERSNLFQNMGRRRWRGPLREPFDNELDMPLERPRMLRRAMDALLGEGFSGRQLIMTALPLPLVEIEQITGTDKGRLSADNTSSVRVINRSSAKLRTVDLETGAILEFPQRAENK